MCIIVLSSCPVVCHPLSLPSKGCQKHEVELTNITLQVSKWASGGLRGVFLYSTMEQARPIDLGVEKGPLPKSERGQV